MMKFDVAQKVCLIVAVPIICQFFFVIVLYERVAATRNELIRQVQDISFLCHLEKFNRDFIKNTATFADEGYDPDKTAGHWGNIDKRIDRVVNGSFNDPELAKLVSKSGDIIKESKGYVSRWVAEHNSPTPNANRMNLIADDVETSSSRLAALDGEIYEYQKKRVEDASPAAKFTNELQRWFLLALLGSIVSSLVLAIFYIRGITKPLGRISENTRLLALDVPMLEPMKGKDQLSELDQLVVLVGRAVRDAKEREQELLGNAAEMICSIDTDGVVTSINRAVQTILQLSPAQVEHLPIFDFIHPEDLSKAQSLFHEAKMKKEGSMEFEIRLQNSDGQPIETNWSASWSDVHASLFCVVRDITEKKNLERLKQNFIDMISHDLRSPLMSIHAAMNLIASGAKGPVPPAVLEGVTSAESATEHLTNLVNDLLDFQKLQSGKMQIEPTEFELKSLIDEAVELLEPIAQKRQISISVPAESLNIRGDRSKIKQTILNFLSNSIKFSPEYGTVKIAIEADTDHVEVSVCDNGPGVPEEFHEKVFEAFEQVPNSPKRKEGSGLGLAICKLIIDGHGGTIGVRNQPAATTGSVFWFRIPR